MEDRGSIPGRCNRLLIVSRASIPALESTLLLSCRDTNLTANIHIVPTLKKAGNYTSIPPYATASQQPAVPSYGHLMSAPPLLLQPNSRYHCGTPCAYPTQPGCTTSKIKTPPSTNTNGLQHNNIRLCTLHLSAPYFLLKHPLVSPPPPRRPTNCSASGTYVKTSPGHGSTQRCMSTSDLSSPSQDGSSTQTSCLATTLSCSALSVSTRPTPRNVY